jgi:hypothetical protein
MAPLTCPVCAAPVRQGDLICINCGANLARREPPPQQQYPSQPDQQPGAYQSQDYQSPEQPYPPQQSYPPQQDQPYRPPHDQQQPYPPQQQQYPPQQQDYQQQRYSQPQGHAPYPPPPEQPYSQPDQQRQPYPPQQDRQQYAPPQPQYPQQQPPQYPPQQQGYGGGYGSPGAPQVPPPPREQTMAGGESTAAFTPFCPHCGAEIPDVGNPVCVQCLRPLHDLGGGGAGAQQVSLFVQLSTGELQVSAGQELVLGRDPVQSPVASTFSRFDNVSRRHATLGIDGNGQAWIRDERSTNGTFVNDRRLQPGEQTPLRDGDSLRLAADARGQVRLGR